MEVCKQAERIANYTGKLYLELSCVPRKELSLRPILTTKGELIEYQLLLDGEINFPCVHENKPQPNKPVKSEGVIRFHPDDVIPTML